MLLIIFYLIFIAVPVTFNLTSSLSKFQTLIFFLFVPYLSRRPIIVLLDLLSVGFASWNLDLGQAIKYLIN